MPGFHKQEAKRMLKIRDKPSGFKKETNFPSPLIFQVSSPRNQNHVHSRGMEERKKGKLAARLIRPNVMVLSDPALRYRRRKDPVLNLQRSYG